METATPTSSPQVTSTPAPSATSKTQPKSPPPHQPPPQNLAATPTSQSSITLTWTDASINEAAFEIERMESGTNFALVSTTGANATTYQDTGLDPATTYTYRIRATNAAGESTYSTNTSATTPAPDTQAPTAPPSLTATPISSTRINLAWSAATDDIAVTTYRIYQLGDPISETANLTYSATDLVPSSSYTFTVTALDAAGNESLASPPASATTASAPSLDDFLVAHWPLDETTGTTAPEILGQHPATLTGAPSWNPIGGQFAGSLDFSEDTHHTTTAPFDLPTTNTGITLAAWVCFRSFDGNANEARLISKATGIFENEHYWMIGNNGSTALRCRLKTANGGTSTFITASGILTTDTWTHVAATYDGTNVRLYKNGTQVGNAFPNPEPLPPPPMSP